MALQKMRDAKKNNRLPALYEYSGEEGRQKRGGASLFQKIPADRKEVVQNRIRVIDSTWKKIEEAHEIHGEFRRILYEAVREKKWIVLAVFAKEIIDRRLRSEVRDADSDRRDEEEFSRVLEGKTEDEIFILFAEKLPKAMGPLDVLRLMSVLPLERYIKKPELKRYLAAYTMRRSNLAVDVSNDEVKASGARSESGYEDDLALQRGLAKRNLLDWSIFLTSKETEQIKRKVFDKCFAHLQDGMENSGTLAKMNASEPIDLGNESRALLERYFGSSELVIAREYKSLNIKLAKSEQSPTFINFSLSGGPAHDMRLNAELPNSEPPIERKKKIAGIAKIYTDSIVHGFPLMGKFTSRDTVFQLQDGMEGRRFIFYCDIDTAERAMAQIGTAYPNEKPEEAEEGVGIYKRRYLFPFGKVSGFNLRATGEEQSDEARMKKNIQHFVPYLQKRDFSFGGRVTS